MISTWPLRRERPRRGGLSVTPAAVTGLILVSVCGIKAQRPRVHFGPAFETGIVGIVSDSVLQPLPGTKVTLRDETGGVVRTVIAGDDGAYLFDCIEDGSYEIEFTLEGFLTSRIEVPYRYPSSLSLHQVLNFDMNSPGPPVLTIEVKDATTLQPIGGASVSLHEFRGVTDACGRIWWAPTGRSGRMRVRKEGYSDTELSVVLLGGRRTVLLMPND